MGEKINATLNGKVVSPSEKQFSLSANSNDKKIAEALLKVVTSEENGFKVVKSNGTVSIPDEKTEAEFHADFRSKEGEIKYEIPTDFQEVDIKLMDMTTLPNMSQSQRYDQSKTMIAGVSAAAIIGTVGYISLQGYSQEARNAALRSKEITDERSRILREIQT